MKILVFILLLLTSIYASGQLTTEIQAKRGVFNERLYLNGKWIDGISTNLYSTDSLSDNLLITAKGISDYIRIQTGNAIPNQYTATNSGNIWIQGTAIMGAHSGYQPTLRLEPAQMYVTQNALKHGLGIQRSSLDQGAADIELFKNNAAGFNTSQALQPGDSIGSISFSGITGNNSRITNTMKLHGLVEKTTPGYLSSGFVFGTTSDTSGICYQRMWLNAQGNLSLGSEEYNAYRLNVALGRVRLGSLAGNNYALLGSDNNGVLRRIEIGNNLGYDEEGWLYLDPESSGEQDAYHSLHVGIINQSGTNAPSELVLDGGSFQWARVATGVYTATLPNNIFFSGYIWFRSEASDESGNAVYTKLYQSGTNTFTLVVKDASKNNIDNWQGISIEVRHYNMQ